MPYTNVTATYDSDDIRITFTGLVRERRPDEDWPDIEDIEVARAVILGVEVLREDVSPALWAAIVGTQAMVSFD